MLEPVKILADKYLYKLDECLPDGVELETYDPAHGFPDHAASADALLIRTVTKINRDTLQEKGNLKFIGSATAGFDHVDTAHLQQLGISFARSAGCNANAVGEYVATSLLRWAEKRDQQLTNKKVGIVGCGHTGSSVAGYLQNLGMETVLYDPPKEKREIGFTSASVAELLSCSVLTFHTPLTDDGPDATHHLCSDDWLNRRFDLIINAARGGVTDEAALLRAHDVGKVRDFILDVWENEPVFSDETAQQAFIATPHIAGYSKQAKFRASKMVADAMCIELGLPLKTGPVKAEATEQPVIDDQWNFSQFLWRNSNIRFYDEKLRLLIGLQPEEKADAFARLRSETKTRNEFGAIFSRLDSIPDRFKEARMFLDEFSTYGN